MLKLTKEIVEKIQAIIIKTGTSEDICNFSYYVENVDIEKLQDAIIKTRDAENICNFALSVEGADINKLKDALIKLGDVWYIDLIK